MRKPLFAAAIATIVWCDQQGDFARAHKYLGDDPKESTYTITSGMQFVKPFDLGAMTDDYQDARLVSQDGHLTTPVGC